MLVLAITEKIKPDRRDEAVQVALRMIEETHKEEGCLAYTFNFPIDDPNTFFIYEEWTSEEALNEHIRSEHMKEFQRQMPAMLVGDTKFKKYVLP